MATSSPASSNEDAAVVKLVSAEGKAFTVQRRAAMVSGMIRTMLSSNAFRERAEQKIEFPDVDSATLELVVAYLEYKLKYQNSPTPAPEFNIPPESALALLVAADYLDL